MQNGSRLVPAGRGWWAAFPQPRLRPAWPVPPFLCWLLWTFLICSRRSLPPYSGYETESSIFVLPRQRTTSFLPVLSFQVYVLFEEDSTSGFCKKISFLGLSFSQAARYRLALHFRNTASNSQYPVGKCCGFHLPAKQFDWCFGQDWQAHLSELSAR